MKSLTFTAENLNHLAIAFHKVAEAHKTDKPEDLLIKNLISETAFLFTKKHNECAMKRKAEISFSIPLNNAIAIMACHERNGWKSLGGWEQTQIQKLINNHGQSFLNLCQN